MNLSQLTSSICFVVLSSSAAQARIGENISECTKRYGPAVFAHDGAVYSFRVFNFSGKKISAYYVNNRSFMEIIKTGPLNLRTHQQAANLGSESMTFFRGLLSDAYNYTEDELKPLANVRQKSPLEKESRADTSAIRAIYQIDTEPNQTTVIINMIVADQDEAKEHTLTEDFKKFTVESITLEYKAKEIKQAEGF